jgi:hypothetical protein
MLLDDEDEEEDVADWAEDRCFLEEDDELEETWDLFLMYKTRIKWLRA